MEHRQIPIWFFVGALIGLYGFIIMVSGIYGWIHPPEHKVVLWELHADVWWGALMLILGAVYVIRFRPQKHPSLT